MDDETLEIRKMTIDEVKQNPPKLNRKFILINSSLYTDEAFEYILELINETDSIAFIRDTKKIYTHGEYFGGDLWEDSLFYFGNFQILDENDEAKITLEAEAQKETLRLKGINNLDIYAEEEYIHGEKFKTIIFNYDISNVVNTTPFTIDDPTAEYNLEIKDNQISVNKYVPIRIEPKYNTTLVPYEIDSDATSIRIPVDVYGSDDVKNIFVTSSTGDRAEFDYGSSSLVIPNLTKKTSDLSLLVVYRDTNTQNSMRVTVPFSFACVYGTENISTAEFKRLKRYIPLTDCNGEITLDIDHRSYGWFACPSVYNPIFIDNESNMAGGWLKVAQKRFYSTNIVYDIYRTENTGLGYTKWTIKNF